ncbi:hypothetical protein HK098_003178 [Nowakowskiella sp. JEL0407]|nr:hypothetical protein HK098_003178 [Nowakowskiella sp. JEL0407]
MYGRQIYKQQLAEIGYNASHERRYFTGVQGDKNNKGELFGIENMFTLYAGKDVITKLIVERSEKAELTYQLVGGNKSGNASVNVNIKEEKKAGKVAAVVEDAFLVECGVDYTHLNQDIIGDSVIEKSISENAIMAVLDNVNTDDLAFFNDEGLNYDFESEIIVGQTPKDIQQQQLTEMSVLFKCESVEQFAFAVLNSEREQRVAWLNEYYEWKENSTGS